MELLGSILADEFEQMAIAMRGKALQAEIPGMKMGARNAALHPELRQAEESADLNSGERDAGRNRRQFTGGDVKQISRKPSLKLISNPNHMAQAMPTTDMGMRIRPSSLAPAGMRSPMLVVIEGGKR